MPEPSERVDAQKPVRAAVNGDTATRALSGSGKGLGLMAAHVHALSQELTHRTQHPGGYRRYGRLRPDYYTADYTVSVLEHVY